MSDNEAHNNKAIVRKFFEALGRGDAAGLGQVLTDDVEAICTGSSVLSGIRHLKEILGVAQVLPMVTQSGIDFEILEMTAEDNRVSCEAQGHSTLVNGAAYDNQYHNLFYLREGRIYRIKEYIDTKLTDTVLAPLMAAGK